MSKVPAIEKPSDFLRRVLSVKNISNLRLNCTAKPGHVEVTLSFVQPPTQGTAFLASSENGELELESVYGATAVQTIEDWSRIYTEYFEATYRVGDKSTQDKLIESFQVWGPI